MHTDIELHSNTVPWLQSYRFTELQSYRVTDVQSYSVTELQKYIPTQLISPRVSELQRFTVTEVLCKTLRPTEQLEKMTKQFAARSYKHRKINKWFSSLPDSSVNTRSSKHRQKLAEVPSRTDRFQNSPIPHMTNILNTLFSSTTQS